MSTSQRILSHKIELNSVQKGNISHWIEFNVSWQRPREYYTLPHISVAQLIPSLYIYTYIINKRNSTPSKKKKYIPSSSPSHRLFRTLLFYVLRADTFHSRPIDLMQYTHNTLEKSRRKESRTQEE